MWLKVISKDFHLLLLHVHSKLQHRVAMRLREPLWASRPTLKSETMIAPSSNVYAAESVGSTV